MPIEVLIEDDRWGAQITDLADRAFSGAIRSFGFDPSDFELSLLACDDARIAALNEDFRQKGTPTNVLSWPSEERGAEIDGATPDAPDPSEPELGDIAISYDTCAREAKTASKPFDHHVIHLIVHGTLHLLGYDHERDADADLMERLETEILGKLDIPDPYS